MVGIDYAVSVLDSEFIALKSDLSDFSKKSEAERGNTRVQCSVPE
jgi:hypothetical protein